MKILKNQKDKGGDKNDIILDFTVNIGDSYDDYCGGDKCNRGSRSSIIWRCNSMYLVNSMVYKTYYLEEKKVNRRTRVLVEYD